LFLRLSNRIAPFRNSDKELELKINNHIEFLKNMTTLKIVSILLKVVETVANIY